MVSLPLWTQYDVWTGLQSWFVHGHWSQCSTQWSSCDYAQSIFSLHGERARRVANVSFPTSSCPFLPPPFLHYVLVSFLAFPIFLCLPFFHLFHVSTPTSPCPSLPPSFFTYLSPSLLCPILFCPILTFTNALFCFLLPPYLLVSFVFPTSFCASMLPLLPFAT